nr:unnamed protein product [Digitaria exilis]
MLARASGLVGKAWQRTTMSAQASASPLHRSHMPTQLCHLHSRPAQPEKFFLEEQHPLQNNSGGALPVLNYISEKDWSKQHNMSMWRIQPLLLSTLIDWFAQMNSEIGGNLNKMRTIGRYNIEMWKATGMALDEVELVWLSDEISQHGDEYWPLVMDIARKNNVRRIRRYCGSRDPYTMGQLTVAETFYTCLQCAGILFQKEDICFKIEKAFCPPKLAEANPCLEYIKYIILPWFGKFEVVRKRENGGKRTFLSMEELTADYESGALQPADVKLALVKSLNKILQVEAFVSSYIS